MGYFSDSLFLYLFLQSSHLLHLLLEPFFFLLYAFLFSQVFLLELHEESTHMGHGEGSIYAEHIDLEDTDVDACLYLTD